ncbi:peroxiredoxin-5, mitochondrial [Macrosteles quadrilineatus]|uniref:peroxiredoxin-5, mitochondrial n=1 Tax=Macrosteles quadrilineatus TaxID=74068 RepID=UPI0023E1D4C7|nr:peroxiredoxin-5, mitochondrial [Macrosteles quadrilineatus]
MQSIWRKPLVNLLNDAAVSRLLSLEALRTLHTTNRLNMPIKIGDKIPSVELYENTPTNKVNIATICEGKKVVLFAVPGAFTPGCSQTHLPGYVSDADNLKAKGISEIICVSVNDPFVMAAWAKDQKTEGKVRLLADPAGAFTKALDLTTDLPPLGGLRSKRYSMLVENGVVTNLNVEPDGTGLSCSLSKNLKVA